MDSQIMKRHLRKEGESKRQGEKETRTQGKEKGNKEKKKETREAEP